MRWSWALVLGACVLVYANSLDNGFHYDDEHSIVHNIHIRSLDNVPAFFADPAYFSRDADKGMYRPLLLVTYALNHAWGGYQVRGYHWVNLGLHALCACLVWWLAGLLGGRAEAALFAGLLFAVHPLTTEPVNYISSRSESLAALFYLLGLGLFVRGGRGDDWLCRGALVLGLLSKSTVITLPAVLLVADYLLGGRHGEHLRRNFPRRHLPLWGLAATYVIAIWANGFLSGSLEKPVRGLGEQLMTQTKALAYYLKLLLVPVGLNVEHQFFVQERFADAILLGALLLVLSGAGLLFWLWRRRLDRALFLCLWGLVSLVPVVVMPLNVLVNERRLYLPCAALCLGAGLLLARRRRLAVALAAILALLTFQRNGVWADEFSLWKDVTAKAPSMPRGHLYLGNAHKDAALMARSQEEAMAHWRQAVESYQRTIEKEPQSDLALRALNNLGAVHFVLEDIDAAEKAYRKAVEINPQYADALVNLGTIYHERARRTQDRLAGRSLLGEAVDYYGRALELLPNHGEAWANRGLAYFDMGDWQKAGEAYARSYELNPHNPRLLNNMGNLYATLAGQGERAYMQRAEHYYRQALQLNPAYEAPRQGLRYIEQLREQGP